MYRYIKRILDFILATIAITILLPLLIPIVLILKFSGEGEVFYLQSRVGLGGNIFYIYKFATMVKNSENIGTGIYTAKNDPRILPFGNFLRLTKINELPQLINILRGEMSIIGPRPLIERTYLLYSEDIKFHINMLKPGLSGAGSLAFRDEETILDQTNDDLESFYANKIAPYKGKLEIWYSENISLKTDVYLIFLTIFLVFFPKSNLFYSTFKNLPKKPGFLNIK